MVDYTDNHTLALPTVGGDTDQWGTYLNEQLIAKLDNILSLLPTIAVAGSDITLTAAQWQNMGFSLTGTLTANINIIVPLASGSSNALKGRKLIYSGVTLGGFSITFKTAATGSVGVTIPNDGFSEVLSEGTHGYLLWAAAATSGGSFVPPTRTITTTGLLTGGGTLAADRTFDVPKASVAECEAGTNDTKAVTPLGLQAGISSLVDTVVASINTGLLNVQVFNSSATYTKTAGAKMAFIIAQGGGGSGAYGGGTNPASGGAAGGVCLKRLDLSAVTTVAVTIGAGGAAAASVAGTAGNAGSSTTFGSYLTAGGGGGGVSGASVASGDGVSSSGAMGGTATGGDANIRGAPSEGGFTMDGSSGAFSTYGSGASGLFGGAGTVASPAAAANSGAGGATDGNGTGSSGAGGSGYVIVFEYA